MAHAVLPQRRRGPAQAPHPVPQPDGSLYAEELMGVEGFSSDSSLLYHRHLPTAIVAARGLRRAGLSHRGPTSRSSRGTSAPTSSTRGRRRRRCSAGSTCWPTTTCGSRTWSPTEPSPLYRNAIGDECVYVESRRARSSRPCSARSTVGSRRLRRHPDVDHPPVGAAAAEPLRLLVVEATGHIGPPKRYLSARASSWSTRRTASATCAGRPSRCWSRARTSRCSCGTAAGRGWTRYVYAHHPFDVVGWDGCLYPYASPSTTSSRSPAGCTSRRRCTRPSRGRTS